MEEFIVSARKYRPLTFDSVVGQRALTTTLKNAIATGKLAHAYLFCGPRGVGKTTCARIFAKAINCLNPKADGDPCGECESCQAFNEQRSMNIHELDAASNNSVDDIRELIQQVQIPPQIGRYKVFIIDEVHMLSTQAFNAFLKTLEEPPSYVIFVLATTEKHKILPTILSRCQVYDFQRMTIQDTIDHLKYVAEKEGYTAEPEALNLIAQKADGGMRDALSILDQMASFTQGQLTYERVCKSLNVLSTEYYFRLVDHFLKNEVEPCLLLLNEILMKGFDAGNFIGGLASHLRDVLVSRDAQTLPLLEMSDQMRNRYHEQAMRCQPKFLYRALKLCNDCDQAYRTSHNKRLQVEICLIQAAQLTEDDGSSGGLGPTKSLNPIFHKQPVQKTDQEAIQPAKTSTSETASVHPEAKPATAAAPSAQPVSAQPVSVQPVSAQPVSAQPVSAQPISAQPISPQPAQVHQAASAVQTKHQNPVKLAGKAQTAALPKLKLSSFSGKKEDKKTETNIATVAEKKPVTPLQEAELHTCWYEIINQLPQEEKAMAMRMRDIRPAIEGTSTVLVTVFNNQVASDMKRLLPNMEAYIQKRMNNAEAKIKIKVAEVETTQKIFSKSERLQKMMEQNHVVSQLVKELDLKID